MLGLVNYSREPLSVEMRDVPVPEIGEMQRLDHRFHLAAHAKQHLGDLPNIVSGAAGTVLGGAVAVSTVFFLTLFLLYELPGLAQMVLRQMPPERRPRMGRRRGT